MCRLRDSGAGHGWCGCGLVAQVARLLERGVLGRVVVALT